RVAVFVPGQPDLNLAPTGDGRAVARSASGLRARTGPMGSSLLIDAIRSGFPRMYDAFDRSAWVRRAAIVIATSESGGLERDPDFWTIRARRSNAPIHGINPWGL